MNNQLLLCNQRNGRKYGQHGYNGRHCRGNKRSRNQFAGIFNQFVGRSDYYCGRTSWNGDFYSSNKNRLCRTFSNSWSFSREMRSKCCDAQRSVFKNCGCADGFSQKHKASRRARQLTWRGLMSFLFVLRAEQTIRQRFWQVMVLSGLKFRLANSLLPVPVAAAAQTHRIAMVAMT